MIARANSGLAVYDALFRAYNADDDVDSQLKELNVFRNGASRNAAFERLSVAEIMAKNARETIEKTKETIKELQERLKNLRTKLSVQRKEIGKEPTKQSASKILRTEAQIDAVNEKMARAKKRLVSAQRRLVVAEDDADMARGILASLDDSVGDDLPAVPVPTDVAVVEPAPVPMMTVPQFTDLTTETKAEDMADEEVKPLFEKDPNILDDEIAFKPVGFNVDGGAQIVPEVVEEVEEETPVAVQPLSFAPPASASSAAETPVAVESAPVLNALTGVPNEKIDSELMATIDIPGFTDVPGVSSESEKLEVRETPEYTEPVAPAVVVPEYSEPTVQEIVEESAPTPMPEIETSPTSPETRPVSPITGATSPVTGVRRKPTMLYYILLIILIILSVFTLWFYQKSAPDAATPALDAQVAVVEEESNVAKDSDKENAEAQEVTEKSDADAPSPFIDLAVVADEVEKTDKADDVTTVDSDKVETVTEESVAEKVAVDTEPVVAEDVIDVDAAVFPDIEPVAVLVAPEPVEQPEEETVVAEETAGSPFLSDEVVAPAETMSVADIIAVKPVYNVSQQEKMFVADPEYETETTDDVEEEVIDENIPVVDYSEPDIVDVEEVVEEVDMCSDGNAPDVNGCCAGESFVDGMCCADGTDECFEPMQ